MRSGCTRHPLVRVPARGRAGGTPTRMASLNGGPSGRPPTAVRDGGPILGSRLGASIDPLVSQLLRRSSVLASPLRPSPGVLAPRPPGPDSPTQQTASEPRWCQDRCHPRGRLRLRAGADRRPPRRLPSSIGPEAVTQGLLHLRRQRPPLAPQFRGRPCHCRQCGVELPPRSDPRPPARLVRRAPSPSRRVGRPSLFGLRGFPRWPATSDHRLQRPVRLASQAGTGATGRPRVAMSGRVASIWPNHERRPRACAAWPVAWLGRLG
jgi:hypothetical protein